MQIGPAWTTNGETNMKCRSAQRYILLAQSDELPASKQYKLEAHLAKCEVCAEYEAEARRILEVAAEELPSGEPGTAVLGSIRMAAGERASKGVVVFPLPIREVLAYAAVLLFLLAGAGAYLARVRQQTSDSQIAHVGIIVELLSEEVITEKTDSRALARQLLRMEGLLIDDFATDEDAIPPEEPLPTDLQTRSTVGFHPVGCV